MQYHGLLWESWPGPIPQRAWKSPVWWLDYFEIQYFKHRELITSREGTPQTTRKTNKKHQFCFLNGKPWSGGHHLWETNKHEMEEFSHHVCCIDLIPWFWYHGVNNQRSEVTRVCGIQGLFGTHSLIWLSVKAPCTPAVHIWPSSCRDAPSSSYGNDPARHRVSISPILGGYPLLSTIHH